MMGAMADAALAKGGEVIGVIPRQGQGSNRADLKSHSFRGEGRVFRLVLPPD